MSELKEALYFCFSATLNAGFERAITVFVAGTDWGNLTHILFGGISHAIHEREIHYINNAHVFSSEAKSFRISPEEYYRQTQAHLPAADALTFRQILTPLFQAKDWSRFFDFYEIFHNACSPFPAFFLFQEERLGGKTLSRYRTLHCLRGLDDNEIAEIGNELLSVKNTFLDRIAPRDWQYPKYYKLEDSYYCKESKEGNLWCFEPRKPAHREKTASGLLNKPPMEAPQNEYSVSLLANGYSFGGKEVNFHELPPMIRSLLCVKTTPYLREV